MCCQSVGPIQDLVLSHGRWHTVVLIVLIHLLLLCQPLLHLLIQLEE